MIQFITGIPGSGKSYYGLFNISIHFAKTLKDNKKFNKFSLSKTKYKSCLTNINELKYEHFENVKKLDFNKFEATLKKLHIMYKGGSTDTELEEYIKDEDFFYTLIVLDECHNFLNKDNEVLIWWLSYHRHFHQDIILITQDVPLVHKSYKVFTEFFYKAIPGSRKLFNTNMIYQQYTGYQLQIKQKSIIKKLPIIKDVFNYYGSGENNKQKSLVLYFLILAFVIFIFLIVVGYFYISSLTSDSTEKPIEQSRQTRPAQNNQSKEIQPIQSNDKKFIKIRCNKYLCFYENKQFTRKFVNEIIQLKEYEYKSLFNDGRYIYFLINDKYNIFIKDITSTQKEIKENENFNFSGLFGN